MKRLILYITLLLSVCLNAQNTVVEYSVKGINSESGAPEFLIYNNNDSFYFDYVDDKKIDISEILINYNILRGGQKFYRKLDEANKLFIIKMYPNLGKKNFLIIDIKPVIKWKIEKDKKEILGYNCIKAIGEFRGRNYIVWFTKEIPTALGPWKLDGLPGLILAAGDTDNIISYEAIKILKNSNLNIPDDVYSFIGNYNKMDIKMYKNYIEYEDAFFKDLQQKGIANLPTGIGNITVPSVRELLRETTFEWEKQPEKP